MPLFGPPSLLLPLPAATARGPAGLNIEGATAIANLATYAALPTDRNIVVTAMNGPLVITLPLASVFSALNDLGRPIHILDMSGACSNVNTITVQTQGGDLINGAASLIVGSQWTSVHCIVMSATTWNADGTASTRVPWFFAEHNRAIVIPSGVWTPLALNTNESDPTNMHPTNTFAGTLAAASNGLVLPQASIAVTVTAGSPKATGGFATITIGGVDTIVQYTGFSGSLPNITLTGGTRGVGTLVTGQAVNDAYESVSPNSRGIYATNGQATWALNLSTTIAAGSNGLALPQATINIATSVGAAAGGGVAAIVIGGVITYVNYTSIAAGQLLGCTGGSGTLLTGQAVGIAYGQRGIRLNNSGFAVGEEMHTSTMSPVEKQSMLANGQPNVGPAAPVRIEVFQDSGVPLNTVPDVLQAPAMGAVFLTPI